ncbi:hypothetical protein Gogos_019644, partial [Gossypium gossypioides]|nr:hypothetical protein [Gossypium gossypioides]
ALIKTSTNQIIEFKDVITNNTKRYSRRKHKKYTGPFLATNPIDRCWQYKKSWAKNCKRVAKCVFGFGYKNFGGNKDEYYLVTDNTNDDVLNPKQGTLCHVNVIIHNIHVHHIAESQSGLIRNFEDHYDYRMVGDGDGISIFRSLNIWLDHISMSECQDGLIDAIQDSTAITISNYHFTHHNKINTCKSQLPSIILARNWYKECLDVNEDSFMSSTMTLLIEKYM